MRPAYPARKLNGAIIILLEQLGTGGMEQVALDMAKNSQRKAEKLYWCASRIFEQI